MDNKLTNFYPAVIPAQVRYDKELSANAKLLYGELTVLCQQKGYCWATNSYFARLYDVDKLTVSRWISSLVKRGYIFFDEVDENINPLDIKINTPRQICIAPLDKKINQNKKNNNKKNKVLSRGRARERESNDFGSFDLELYEEMLRSQDYE